MKEVYTVLYLAVADLTIPTRESLKDMKIYAGVITLVNLIAYSLGNYFLNPIGCIIGLLIILGVEYITKKGE